MFSYDFYGLYRVRVLIMTDNRLISVIISFITCTKSVLFAKIELYGRNNLGIFKVCWFYLIDFLTIDF